MLEHQTWLAPGEAAILTGCSKKTLLHAIRCGDLRARQYNERTIRIHRDDLFHWVRAVEKAAIDCATGTTVLSGTRSDGQSRKSHP